MVLLNMISKLTLTVKPQSTLRTLKWVARPPDGTFIKRIVIYVESLTYCLLRNSNEIQISCTCAQPCAFEKLSSLAMMMSSQVHCMWKSHPKGNTIIEWLSLHSSFLPCGNWGVHKGPTPCQRWTSRTGTGTPPPLPLSLTLSRFPSHFHLPQHSPVRLSHSKVWSGQFGSLSETIINSFLITAIYHGWTPGS